MRSSPTRLLESLKTTTEGDASIGKVRCLPNGPLMHFARKALKHGYLTVAANAAHTLLVKHPAFRHESEIRLLLNKQKPSGSKLVKYQVDSHTLVDRLMLDPRLSPEEAAKVKTAIRNKTGYRGSIKAVTSTTSADLIQLWSVAAGGRPQTAALTSEPIEAHSTVKQSRNQAHPVWSRACGSDGQDMRVDLPAFFGPLITGEQRRPARLDVLRVLPLQREPATLQR